MKYLKETPKKKLPLGIWISAAVLILAVVLLLTMCGGQNADQTPDPSFDTTGNSPSDVQNNGSEDETVADDSQGETNPENSEAQDPSEQVYEAPDSTEAPVDPVQIHTPYRTLHYPGDWEKVLEVEKIEGVPYTLIFRAKLDSGKVQELFTIKLGGDSDNAVGTTKSDSGEAVPVHVASVDFTPDDSWTSSETNVVYYMMEALNDVLADMDLQPIEEEPTHPTIPELNDEDMAIDTPYGEVHYPSRWSEYLDIQITEGDVYSIAFYCVMEGHEKLHLFTVHFGGSEGALLTTVTDANGKSVEARVTISELDLDSSWTDSEKSTAYAMQEDMNYLLSKLS